MLEDYSNYYSEASELFSKYGSALAEISFNGQKQALEVYCLTTIALCKSHAKAISVLLKNDSSVESIIIARGIFEIFCNFCWIARADSVAAQNECVFSLEAKPYSAIAKEVGIIGEDARNSNPVWKATEYQQMKKLLEDTANHSPWLLRATSSKKLDFKTPPDLVAQMGPDIRLRFYHLYRFASVFTHPTPMLKSILLQQNGQRGITNNEMNDAVEKFLANGLLFLEVILHFCEQVFSQYGPELGPVRNRCYEKMRNIAKKGKKGYLIQEDPA